MFHHQDSHVKLNIIRKIIRVKQVKHAFHEQIHLLKIYYET